ncbi:MAG: tetratricopeptide repeat protein [Terriglobia bacterium]
MRLRSLVLLLMLAVALPPIPTVWAQQKCFTEVQVSNMVRDGFGDESGAKLIEQRGIDFAPAEDFIQTLKAAGASEAFLKPLRAAKPPEPTSAKKPINQVQVFALLVGQVPSHRVTMLVQERGVDFEPTDDYLQEVRLAGGEDELISALKSAKVTKPVSVTPAAEAKEAELKAAEAKQAELRQHAARGAESFQKSQYTAAEAEYRAAVLLDPQNSDLRVALSRALNRQRKVDEALAEAREAVRLSPNNDMAHYSLGYAMGSKADWDGAMAEEREALRLNPNNDLAHNNLGVTLGIKGDRDGAMAEYREALRLNPNLDLAHVNLGVALGNKGDWDGDIAEQREALRLNPNNDAAHADLGLAVGVKGDWDGEIAEEREALRLNPNLAGAHFGLGFALEQKGDRRQALEEYRAAYMLDPKNALYKRDYERLLHRMKK